MGYLINDALDELVDLIVSLLGDEPRDEHEDQGSVPVLVRPLFRRLNVELSDEQVMALEARVKARRLSESGLKVNMKRADVKLSNLVKLDNQRSDGLLGRLVAQYWASARARAWYQVRCGALTWDDDTPAWNHRDHKRKKKADLPALLARPDWYGVVLSEADFRERWTGKNSDSTNWLHRYSLEATFSNWSAPPWFEWAFTNDRYFGDPYHTIDEAPGRWGGKVMVSPTKRYAVEQQKAPVQWKEFLSGEVGFGDMMQHLGDACVFHAYNEYVTNWQDKGTYANVGTGRRAYLSGIPWRTCGRYVSADDRRRANYRLKPVSGTWERTKKDVTRYYGNGYYLVRTALDVLIARGQDPSKIEGFGEHCDWWGIAAPTKEFIDRAPNLEFIGGGVVGLADVESAELVRYVKAITPPPGSIPPWEDKGPLWKWPTTTGHMFCSSVPIQLKPRKSSNVWGTIAQYVLGVEQSICFNVASGVLDEAVDTILQAAKDIAAEWLSRGVDKVMDALETKLGSAAFDAAKDLLSDVSSVASNIQRYADADALVGKLAGSAQLPVALTEYLDGVADQVDGSDLVVFARRAQNQIDTLREEWDWADDLLGSCASLGTDVKQVVGSLGD